MLTKCLLNTSIFGQSGVEHTCEKLRIGMQRDQSVFKQLPLSLEVREDKCLLKEPKSE